ncbi:hypothetical protein Q5424_09385 [Conexibacter sp. JD483]|uniref:hypothetical protein n=1 Tax=unclassified Conexibacter TaxID=2627773 RepID=UPI0027287548|nr:MULTISPECIES: hypothetical protein [unclassified Conexibacter]MDO8187211.1 hypothetical protein [Conexibacter sp. CPCC 205706]MDO8199308.1 hypothetical protein [Conexibacter sp. CPCC 205762]MDR9369291.1 hypothetical protein [Conexibacter sp. JD483]
MELALALGLDRIAERLVAGDAVERVFWRERLAGADRYAAKRDERLAHFIAQLMWR